MNLTDEVKKHTQRRLDANRAIVKRLSELIEANPSMRFSQILFNFGFVNGVFDDKGEHIASWADEFSVEPWDVAARLGEWPPL